MLISDRDREFIEYAQEILKIPHHKRRLENINLEFKIERDGNDCISVYLYYCRTKLTLGKFKLYLQKNINDLTKINAYLESRNPMEEDFILLPIRGGYELGVMKCFNDCHKYTSGNLLDDYSVTDYFHEKNPIIKQYHVYTANTLTLQIKNGRIIGYFNNMRNFFYINMEFRDFMQTVKDELAELVAKKVIEELKNDPSFKNSIKGDKGSPGLQGVTKTTGYGAIKGEKGAPGLLGLPGIQGEKGPKGERGEIGVPGKPGLDGAPGKDGLQGPKGNAGDKGEPGKAGAPGKDGAVGQAGQQGEKGDKGNSGKDGGPGLAVAPGQSANNTEIAGLLKIDRQFKKDIKGERGDRGFRGNAGDKGEPGKDGLQGLRGEQGLKGDRGSMGFGMDGDKGSQGEKGERGLTGYTGSTGKSGTDGSPGLRGEQGLKGDIGLQGSAGLKGERGFIGIQGIKGDIGISGLDGVPGKDGLQGSKGDRGEKGLVGPVGPKGEAGTDGAPGLQGNTGAPGLTGEIGLVGPAGPRGEVGRVGASGTDGDKGSQGDKGERGLTGYTGSKGNDGKKGEAGQDGLPGIEGLIGPKGDMGLQGNTGAPGLKGDKGDKGSQGIPGLDGVPGKDGLQGSQGDKGPKGDMGLQGNTGAPGLKGDKGDKGSQGIPGLDGVPGKDGLQGSKGDRGVKGDIGLPGPQGEIGKDGTTGAPGEKGNEPDLTEIKTLVDQARDYSIKAHESSVNASESAKKSEKSSNLAKRYALNAETAADNTNEIHKKFKEDVCKARTIADLMKNTCSNTGTTRAKRYMNLKEVEKRVDYNNNLTNGASKSYSFIGNIIEIFKNIGKTVSNIISINVNEFTEIKPVNSQSAQQCMINNSDTCISDDLKAQAYACDIVKKFEEAIKSVAIQSGMPVQNINFDCIESQSAVKGEIISCKYDEIQNTLRNAIKCKREFKQNTKFFEKLNVKIDQILGDCIQKIANNTNLEKTSASITPLTNLLSLTIQQLAISKEVGSMLGDKN